MAMKLLFTSSISAEQRVRHLWKSNRVLYYRFADKVMQNQVSKAILHIYVHDIGSHHEVEEQVPASGGDGSQKDELTLNIQISRVTKVNDAFTSSIVASAGVAVTRSEEKKGMWVKVNVTKVLSEWFEMPRSVLGLVVRTQDSERRKIPVPVAKGEKLDTVRHFSKLSILYLFMYLSQ